MATVEDELCASEQLTRNLSLATFDPAIAEVLAAPEAPEQTVTEATLSATIEELATLVEAHDSYTGEHAAHVSGLSERLAVALGCSREELRTIAVAGRLHDVGKVAVPDAVLHKPDVLTTEERDVMRAHAVIGAEIVGRIPDLRPIAALIRAHHERWDGTGYPDGLAGAEIPLGARVLAVADAYFAITTSRPYQAARDHTFAVAEIERCSGSQFDPAVVRALEDLPVSQLLH